METSISSGGDGYDTGPDTAAMLAENPHIKFFDNQRGYVRCQVTPEAWKTDYRVLPYVTEPGAPVATRKSSSSSPALGRFAPGSRDS